MSHFEKFTSTAAVFAEANIDTDVIFPARFLLLIDREGLAEHLFEDRRVRADGSENAEFVLNDPKLRGSAILVAGANFGCGSSREHAVWALRDSGVRCVIAPSFGEIFYANCFRNGVLPIVLDESALADVREWAGAGGLLTIDLAAGFVRYGETEIPFEVTAARRDALLNGLDDISEILVRDLPAIEQYEARRGQSHPWLFL